MLPSIALRPHHLVLAAAVLAGPALAADSARGHAYVSNQNGGVTVIDLAQMKTVGEISTGASAPRGIGVSGDGRLLVTANRDGGTLSVIDRQSGALIKLVPIGENPEFVRVRGNQVFVSYEPASKGGPPPKPGSKEARELAEKRERENPDPARIAVVDLTRLEVIQTIVGGLETEGIEFSADGRNILITNEDDDNVTVHEIASGKLIKTIDLSKYGKRPRGIKMAPDGKSYIATIEFGNTFVVLDDKYDIVRSVPTGAVPYGVAFDRPGKRLFVALAYARALQVFDAATYTPIKEIPTGERCWHFSFTPDDRQILVACGRSHEVVVIDTETLEVTQRIADKQLPWGVVTWPKSIGSLDVPEPVAAP